MIPLIIDHRIEACSGDGPTLLTATLGQASLLEHALAWLGRELSHTPIVLAPADAPADYERTLQACAARKMTVVRAGLTEALQGLEASDRLLIVDAARVPLLDVDLAELRGVLDGYRAASHLVAVGTGVLDNTRERVDCDGLGRVRRVQRLLGAACWPEVADRTVLLSVVPAGLLKGMNLTTLDDLRQALAVRGVLTRDEPLELDLVDLRRSAGLLALNERLLLRGLADRPPSGFKAVAEDVLVAVNSRVHPSARLVGPLVVHDDVTIAADATLIGPGVVAARCHVGEGAVVAHALMLPGARVDGGAAVSHRVVAGQVARTDAVTYSAGQTAAVAGGLSDASRKIAAKSALTSRVTALPSRRKLELTLKRGLDCFTAIVLLVALGPLMMLVAVVIKLTSPGPILFAHRRERAGATEFSCLKFRTMVADAHSRQREMYAVNNVDGPQFKMDADPRITPIGWFLRATNIDELPQLFNVLLGHMSLVGPRPSPLRENQICIPWRRARLSVQPGITGLWQICRSADRSQGDFHEWIYYDMNYVKHFSLWLDLKILVATVVTLGGRRSVPMAWVLRRTVGR